MKYEKAQEIQEALQKSFPALKSEIKDAGVSNAWNVVASAKQLEVKSKELNALSEITKGQSITFGRTGANFRMIIS